MSTTYLCSVGLDDYDDMAKLDFATNDAREIFATLTDRDVGTATLDRASLHVGRQATRENVSRSLGQFAGDATPNDLIVFYFAGHAVAHQGETYLMLHGERAGDIAVNQLSRLSVSQIHRLLANSKAELSVMIIDACHIGESASAIYQQQVNLGNSRGNSNCLVLFGGSTDSLARESAEEQHGTLTSRVIAHLRHGRADLDGAIRVRGLLSLLPDELGVLNGSLTSNPVLAWRSSSGPNIEVELALGLNFGTDSELGAPIHSLDKSLPWLDYLVRAARSSGELGATRTELERWSKFVEALCNHFGLSGAVVFESGGKGEPSLSVVCEYFDPSIVDQAPDYIRLVASRMGRAFTDPDLWSRSAEVAYERGSTWEAGQLLRSWYPLAIDHSINTPYSSRTIRTTFASTSRSLTL